MASVVAATTTTTTPTEQVTVHTSESDNSQNENMVVETTEPKATMTPDNNKRNRYDIGLHNLEPILLVYFSRDKNRHLDFQIFSLF